MMTKNKPFQSIVVAKIPSVYGDVFKEASVHVWRILFTVHFILSNHRMIGKINEFYYPKTTFILRPAQVLAIFPKFRNEWEDIHNEFLDMYREKGKIKINFRKKVVPTAFKTISSNFYQKSCLLARRGLKLVSPEISLKQNNLKEMLYNLEKRKSSVYPSTLRQTINKIELFLRDSYVFLKTTVKENIAKVKVFSFQCVRPAAKYIQTDSRLSELKKRIKILLIDRVGLEQHSINASFYNSVFAFMMFESKVCTKFALDWVAKVKNMTAIKNKSGYVKTLIENECKKRNYTEDTVKNFFKPEELKAFGIRVPN